MAPKSKLILASEVNLRLVLPTTGLPIGYSNFAKILKKLEITPVSMKVDGKGYPRNFITEEQAAEVEADFKRVHWKKFKAVQK